ncbi:uncharacterized protein LOC119667451 [Teleopsis dalmanni]|uniref:uncharacterized protein LOC119667451 n=1 Tax=Teleopsis dalmanni TaxID=139649 RepID=UPI0018CDBA16|nr:uncharacterized protein LOC119667451 [Teleopsis dalmanni]
MNKYTLALALILVALATTDARCNRQCRSRDRSPSVCIREAGTTNMCRRIRECRMREENCRRGMLGQPNLRQTSLIRCRKIKMDSRGRCASKLIKDVKNVHLCNKMRCDEKRIVSCYRSDANRCRLMTNCQARRINCMRDSWNQIMITRRRGCRGMKLGEGPQVCRK